MSAISNATAPAAASLSSHFHGHKKALLADAMTPTTTAVNSSTNPSKPTSTLGLFGNLLHSLTQLVGIPAITSTSASATGGAPAAAPVASSSALNGASGAQPALGGLVNTRV